MYGAIIGDIAGSKYEFLHFKEIPKVIMDKECFFTDDTVMTVAIADALLNNKDIAYSLAVWGHKYPNRGYGNLFGAWLENVDFTPYFSYGNGSAMRVSAAGWLGNTMFEVLDLATQTAIVTHNHPEGIKGAQAVAYAIYLAKFNTSKKDIKDIISNTFGYNLNFKLDDIRSTYRFNETCMDTVPQAIVAFLESKDFESAIKLAISLGGDADTLAAITGSIAEAYYGIPENLIKRVKAFLPKEMINILEKI